MSNPDPIPVAVVGTGRMGRHHVRICSELPEADLLAVVDPDADRAGALADQYNCDDLRSVDELLAKYPHVKAATIAAPTVHHAAVAEPLLAAGVACLVEKPLAESSDVARRIVELGEAHDTVVQVGHTERFNPAVRAISELDITPRFIEVDRVSPMTFRSVDVGVVFDIMIHDIDIVLMMARSEVVDVRATGVAVLGEHEDVANARLEFADGCVANLTASRLAMKTERKLRVFSESAYISLNYATKEGVIMNRTANDAKLQEIRSELAAGADLSSLDWTEVVSRQEIAINDEEPLRAEQQNFLAAVRGEQQPAVPGRAGLAAVDIAERVVASIATHAWTGVESPRIV